MFHVRRRPADYHPRKRKKKPSHKGRANELLDYRYEDAYERLPYLLELNPDGSDVTNGAPKRHRLQLDVTEVGGERPPSAGGGSSSGSGSQTLQLFGPNIQPRHCVIAHTGGIVTVTPCSRDAETYVKGQRIYETTILQHGVVVKFGRIHNFRFLDPSFDERTRQRHDSSRHEYSYDSRQEHDTSSLGPATQNYETTFDVDGHVETVSTASLKQEDSRSQRSVSSSGNNRPPSTYDRYPRGQDPILPAVLEFREETRDALFDALIPSLEPAAVHFKLAPTYALYLAARYRASTHFRPDLTPTERAHRLSTLLERLAAMIQAVIQERYSEAESLAFWMANASEFLHFLKSDRHISAFSLDAQDILAETVQMAFRNLVECLQAELAAVMPVFLSEADDAAEDEPATAVLAVLAGAMALLRRCRVNAALTIQLFSQLFHFINMWAFNRMVCGDARLCTRQWGLRLKARLAHIEEWAEKQGLELAADCHLSRIIQAAHLLQAPKYNADDLATLSSTCFKLNSMQLRALLHRYQPAPQEPRLPLELIDNVVRVAESVADELARSDGREVRLEEDVELALPFLLPEDGYSCDVVRGMPVGLAELLAPLQNAGLCRVNPQPTSSGLWTIYMADHAQHGPRSPSAMSNRSAGFSAAPQQEPEVQQIKLHKSNNGMGLSIVAAKGAGQERLGIYIKSVVKGGAADADGRLQAGDQLLKVDGQSLVGITQEKAAEYLVRTGPVVTLEVAKQGAIYHGLATLLSQPSPVMGRARPEDASSQQQPVTLRPRNILQPQQPPAHHYEWAQPVNITGPRRMSERDLPNRVLTEQNQQNSLRPMHTSKSVPALNSDAAAPAPVKPHEVFNPGYSRTSSTNSIPQHPGHQSPNTAALRSRSSHNLHDGVHGMPPLPPQHIGQQQVRSTPVQQVPGQPTPQQESERFYQNLSVYRDRATEHIQNGYPAAPASPSRGKMPSPHDDRLLNQQKAGGPRGSQTSLPRTPAEATRERPASAYIPQKQDVNGPQHPHGPMMASVPRSQSARDMMRQEAKLHEMQEEVRRREARGAPALNSPNNGHYYPPGQHPAAMAHSRSHPQLPPQAGGPQMRPSNTFPAGYPDAMRQAPPTAPKPRGPVQDTPPGRPPPPEDSYRESPPPPPPPTTTHPLYQPPKQPTDNRYAASMGEPPRGAYMPTTNARPPHPQQQQPPYGGTNPWDREEREKEALRRREAARQWRDQQISELEATPTRTPQQDEQLRALRLEREFQRRAEEAASQGDDDEDEENGAQDEQPPQGLLMRSTEEALRQQQFQQNMQRARLVHNGEPPRPHHSPNVVDSPQSSSPYGGHGPPNHQFARQDPNVPPGVQYGRPECAVPPNVNNQYGRQLEERDRQRKLEEMRRKQLELEAAREAEERILRDAQRRKEEELRQQREQQLREQQQMHLQQHYQQQQQLQLQQQQLQQQQPQASPSYQPASAYTQQPPPSPYAQQPPPSPYAQQAPASPSQRQTNHMHPGMPPSQQQYKATTPLRLEGLGNNSTAHYNGHATTPNGPYSPHEEGSQRLDSLVHSNGGPASPAPPPPERGSSFSIMSHQQQQQQPGGVLRNSATRSEQPPKRVSFHDPKASPPEQNNHIDRPREDPNNFINEAQTLLATPRSPDGSFSGNTPGVIGAQEVYKDPRMRRLAEQQHQKLLATRVGPGPEKLSFKEKMKMFAMETGEDGTPKDKVKISRAQRDIEGPNINNNSLSEDRNY